MIVIYDLLKLITNNMNRASSEKSDGAYFFKKFFKKFSNTITCNSDLFGKIIYNFNGLIIIITKRNEKKYNFTCRGLISMTTKKKTKLTSIVLCITLFISLLGTMSAATVYASETSLDIASKSILFYNEKARRKISPRFL